jgi:hypothetical protein
MVWRMGRPLRTLVVAAACVGLGVVAWGCAPDGASESGTARDGAASDGTALDAPELAQRPVAMWFWAPG